MESSKRRSSDASPRMLVTKSSNSFRIAVALLVVVIVVVAVVAVVDVVVVAERKHRDKNLMTRLMHGVVHKDTPCSLPPQYIYIYISLHSTLLLLHIRYLDLREIRCPCRTSTATETGIHIHRTYLLYKSTVKNSDIFSLYVL